MSFQTLADLIQQRVFDSKSRFTVHQDGVTEASTPLSMDVAWCYAYLLNHQVLPGQRVVVQLAKSQRQVALFFALWQLGAVVVPAHLSLKYEQVAHIAKDCQASLVVVESSRLQGYVTNQPDMVFAVLNDDALQSSAEQVTNEKTKGATLYKCGSTAGPVCRPDIQPSDIAALMYTSGSTGLPKGVVLSHQNLMLGACAVVDYLQLSASDVILAALPFSFDYGLNQLLAALWADATVVLHDYLLAPELIRIANKYQVTVLAAVPPLWQALSQARWPDTTASQLRVWTNSGGALHPGLSSRLSQLFINARGFLMYGLTEAFRASFLKPELIAVKPTSVGQAIPYATLAVVRPDGSECAPEEVGELVQAGPLVSLGYWHAAEKTAERFKPWRNAHGKTELAVWSGDLFYKDHDGDLFFVGRADDMLKCSGFRISPTEVEHAVQKIDPRIEYAVALAPAISYSDHAVLLLISAQHPLDIAELHAKLRATLPSYAMPKAIVQKDELPRTPNGKLDRAVLKKEYKDFFSNES